MYFLSSFRIQHLLLCCNLRDVSPHHTLRQIVGLDELEEDSTSCGLCQFIGGMLIRNGEGSSPGRSLLHRYTIADGHIYCHSAYSNDRDGLQSKIPIDAWPVMSGAEKLRRPYVAARH